MTKAVFPFSIAKEAARSVHKITVHKNCDKSNKKGSFLFSTEKGYVRMKENQ